MFNVQTNRDNGRKMGRKGGVQIAENCRGLLENYFLNGRGLGMKPRLAVSDKQTAAGNFGRKMGGRKIYGQWKSADTNLEVGSGPKWGYVYPIPNQ
jgi:hypothetical protein